MKIIKWLIVIITVISLTGCNRTPFEKELSQYIANSQLIELTKEEYDEKLLNGDDFIIFIKKEDCSACINYYPIVAEFLKSNPDKVMYFISFESLEGFDVLTFAANLFSVFGDDYYTSNEIKKTSIPTPSTIRVNNNRFEDAMIGTISVEDISKLYVSNYYSYNDYYSFSRKVSNHNIIKFFVNTKKDDEYEVFLKNYFITNKNDVGYYLDGSNLNYTNTVKLLNRINNYLGKDNKIDDLPDYMYFEFENGYIINYLDEKIDSDKIEELYK